MLRFRFEDRQVFNTEHQGECTEFIATPCRATPPGSYRRGTRSVISFSVVLRVEPLPWQTQPQHSRQAALIPEVTRNTRFRICDSLPASPTPRITNERVDQRRILDPFRPFHAG